MSKYDWSNVPSEVKWIATDYDGVVNGFDSKPSIVIHHRMWFENNDGSGWFLQIRPKVISSFDWQDSLEERPE